MAVFGWFVLTLVFVDELLAMAALGVWGWQQEPRWLLVWLLPAVAMFVWGTFASPRAARGGPVVRPVVKVVVLGLAGLIAALVSRQGPSGVPTEVASATRAPLELPLKVNDLQRDPNAQQETAAPSAGSAMTTVTGTYNVQGTPTLVVVAGRPVGKPDEMLTMVEARAVRQVGSGWCGRAAGQDIDVCVVVKGDTAVMGGGLRQQPVEEIVAQAQSIADALPE